MALQQCAHALRQVKYSLYNRIDTNINKYEVCKRLDKLIET
jgi:hypothetical protein